MAGRLASESPGRSDRNARASIPSCGAISTRAFKDCGEECRSKQRATASRSMRTPSRSAAVASAEAGSVMRGARCRWYRAPRSRESGAGLLGRRTARVAGPFLAARHRRDEAAIAGWPGRLARSPDDLLQLVHEQLAHHALLSGLDRAPVAARVAGRRLFAARQRRDEAAIAGWRRRRLALPSDDLFQLLDEQLAHQLPSSMDASARRGGSPRATDISARDSQGPAILPGPET